MNNINLDHTFLNNISEFKPLRALVGLISDDTEAQSLFAGVIEDVYTFLADYEILRVGVVAPLYNVGSTVIHLYSPHGTGYATLSIEIPEQEKATISSVCDWVYTTVEYLLANYDLITASLFSIAEARALLELVRGRYSDLIETYSYSTGGYRNSLLVNVANLSTSVEYCQSKVEQLTTELKTRIIVKDEA